MLFIELAPGKGNSIESGLECIQTISSIYGLFLLARGHSVIPILYISRLLLFLPLALTSSRE